MLIDVPHEQLERFATFDTHERVLYFIEERAGLEGFFALHRTIHGAAVGGTRFWSYATKEEALNDALRLSRGMTYKCALASVPMGGGKGVIIKPRQKYFDRTTLLQAYAEILNSLGGSFYTGEDVGLTQNDIAILARFSSYIIGKPGVGGDPGPWAGRGVFHAIEAALEHVYGDSTIAGRTFAIKGVGKVGSALCELLHERGGKIVVADTDATALEKAREAFPNIEIVPPAQIQNMPVDVYAPCALGGEFDKETVENLACRIVCGGANNQLAHPGVDQCFLEKGILYIPDYIANAGGLLNVVAELDSEGYQEERVAEKVRGIKDTVKCIIGTSVQSQKTTQQVANELAESIFMSL